MLIVLVHRAKSFQNVSSLRFSVIRLGKKYGDRDSLRTSFPSKTSAWFSELLSHTTRWRGGTTEGSPPPVVGGGVGSRDPDVARPAGTRMECPPTQASPVSRVETSGVAGT